MLVQGYIPVTLRAADDVTSDVPAGCDVTLRANNGSLYSPAYGVADYPTNLECDYLIQRPDGGPLSLRFTHLTLDQTDGVQVSLRSPGVTRGHCRSPT